MKWFRVYSEIKDDPKMLELDDHQFRLWMSLLAMANEAGERGVITGCRPRGLAAALRTDEERLANAIDLFIELEMIEYDETDRSIIILNWTDRQYDKPSDAPEATRERKRRSRVKDTQPSIEEDMPRDSHADVTPGHAESRDILYAEAENTQTQTRQEAEAEESAAACVRETAEILVSAGWIGDDLGGIIKRVDRSFQLVPAFDTADAPVEAEKFVRYHSGSGRKKRPPPDDWYRAWLNWIKREAKDQPSPVLARDGNGAYDPTAIWLEWAENPDEQDDIRQGHGAVIDVTASEER